MAGTSISTEKASKRSAIIRRAQMKTVTATAAHKLGSFLTKDFRRIFGPAHDDVAERLGALARSTIECLDRSDALYHNFEHTLQVTRVGRDILQGMALSQRIEPSDYSHLIVACLLHDIGYMRGVLTGDTATEFVVDGSGKKVALPRGASDAALTPYHVDRSKLFAFERLRNSPVIDAARIAAAIEMTRFPVPPDRSADDSIEPKLVRAADFIGQLGDPMYLRKANALFCEFEEIGKNRQLGYSSPADIVDKYPAFFWDSVSMHLDDGIKYLNMTVSGRQWIANLHHHILCAEHGRRLLGPQS
jgi:HD domain